MVTHEDWVAELHKLDFASDFTLEEGWFSASELCEVWKVGRSKSRSTIKQLVALGRANQETGYRTDCTGKRRPTPVYRLLKEPPK